MPESRPQSLGACGLQRFRAFNYAAGVRFDILQGTLSGCPAHQTTRRLRAPDTEASSCSVSGGVTAWRSTLPRIPSTRAAAPAGRCGRRLAQPNCRDGGTAQLRPPPNPLPSTSSVQSRKVDLSPWAVAGRPSRPSSPSRPWITLLAVLAAMCFPLGRGEHGRVGVVGGPK